MCDQPPKSSSNMWSRVTPRLSSIVSTADAADVDPAARGESLPRLAPGEIDAVVREVIRLLSDDAVREIAREVVPELAEAMIREELHRLVGD